MLDEMTAALTDQDLYASAPLWDGKWLSALLRAAGHPRRKQRLRKSDEAFMDLAKEMAGSSVSEGHRGPRKEHYRVKTEPTNRRIARCPMA